MEPVLCTRAFLAEIGVTDRAPAEVRDADLFEFYLGSIRLASAGAYLIEIAGPYLPPSAEGILTMQILRVADAARRDRSGG